LTASFFSNSFRRNKNPFLNLDQEAAGFKNQALPFHKGTVILGQDRACGQANLLLQEDSDA